MLQEQVARLVPGRRAHVGFAALPDESFDGRTLSVDPIVDRVTGRAE